MPYKLFISLRYLFAKKHHNAINVVSAVSALGVAIAAAAMVCVLSVMNGFGNLVEDMFSLFDPDLRITAAQGSSFRTNTATFDAIREWEEVESLALTIEQNALVRFSDRQTTALIKGVEADFNKHNSIDSTILDGEFMVYDGAFERGLVGIGLANTLGIGAHFVSPMRLYAPKRHERINMLAPERSLNQEPIWIAGVFSVGQLKYDDAYMLVSIEAAQRLFEYADDEATAVEIQLRQGASVKNIKRKLRKTLGDSFVVADRYEQQADFFKILEIEKLLTALLLTFIVLIAALNIVGALSMLMLEKKADIAILESMGAAKDDVRDIFLLEGWLISVSGAIAGVVIGVILCLLQQNLGIIKLGNGSNYIVSAYPVALQATDILIVLAIVLLLGLLVAFIPARQVNKY